MDESTATHIDELSRKVNDQARRITTLETLVMTLNEGLLELEAEKPPRFQGEDDEAEYWNAKCGLPS